MTSVNDARRSATSPTARSTRTPTRGRSHSPSADDDGQRRRGLGDIQQHSVRAGGELVFGGSGSIARDRHARCEPERFDNHHRHRVTDSGGAAATEAFVLTVRPGVLYTFVGVQNVPTAVRAKPSRLAAPCRCSGCSSKARPSSTARRSDTWSPCAGRCRQEPIRTFTNTDPGSSSFRYDAASKTWQFNLQTKDVNGQAYPVGCYDITIMPTDRATSQPVVPVEAGEVERDASVRRQPGTAPPVRAGGVTSATSGSSVEAAANAEVGAVGVGEVRALEPLAHSTLVVVDRSGRCRTSVPRRGTVPAPHPAD